MDRLTRIGSIAMLSLFLLSCSPSLEEGEIYDKAHKPAETIMIMMPMVVGKSTILMPMVFFYPERWRIDIKKFDGKQWVKARWWVDKGTFEAAQIGGWYKYKEGDLDDEPRYKCAECPTTETGR